MFSEKMLEMFLVYKRQDLAQKLHDQWPKCANMAELLHEKCLQGRESKKTSGCRWVRVLSTVPSQTF
jgi:hypothetical protein